MNLTHKQKNYIKKNFKKKSLRQIAINLGLSEETVQSSLKRKLGNDKYQKLLIKTNPESKILNLGNLNINWKIFFFLFFLTAVSYLNSLNNGFVSDDIDAIVKNENLKDFSHVLSQKQNFIRPLFLFIAYKIGELNPLFYRTMNIFFHFGTTCVIYLILKLITKPRIAFFTAVIFVVHPILTESVTWISGGPYSLYSLFFLISFLSYILTKKNNKFYLISIISFFLSLSSSEKAISLPLVFLLFEICFGNLKQNWKKLLPFFMMISFWMIFLLKGFGERTTSLQASYATEKGFDNPLLQIPIAISSYLELIFFPFNLTIYHSEMSFALQEYLLRLVIFLGFLGLIVIGFKKNRQIFFWLSFFAITLLPTLTPFRISWIVAERYVYLGSLGIFATASIIFEKIAKNPRFKMGFYLFFTALIAMLMLRTIIRNVDWQNEDNLWIATGKISPSSPNTHNNLGDVYGRRGDLEMAVKEFKKAIELKPNYADAYHNLGNTYKDLGKINEAIDSYKRALHFNPALWQSSQNLAAIYLNNKSYDLAEENIKKAIKINPKNLNLKNNLGIIYFKMGDKDRAKQQFFEVLSSDPNNRVAKQGLAELSK